jgi:hypothetical protein
VTTAAATTAAAEVTADATYAPADTTAAADTATASAAAVADSTDKDSSNATPVSLSLRNRMVNVSTKSCSSGGTPTTQGKRMVLSHATQAHGILLIATRPVPNSGKHYTWYLLLEVPPASLASLLKPTVLYFSSDTLSSFNQTNHSLCSIPRASSLFLYLPSDLPPSCRPIRKSLAHSSANENSFPFSFTL